MRRMVATMLSTLALIVVMAVSASAKVESAPPADDYDDSQSHPLRIAAYLAYPIGYSLEWLVFRPFHRLISQPGLAPVFGHGPHSDEASIGTR